MFKKIVPLFSLVALATLSGCVATTVHPQDVETIKLNRDNAAEINSRVQVYTKIVATSPDGTETDITGWVKRWWSDEVRSWSNLSNWANGQPATTNP